jgi:S-adenosyl-L-methionine hydrolase (adenosine-forming)
MTDYHFITLTTDFGHQDHYVAVLKGAIYQTLPEAKLIDLSHGIKPFNIPQAELVVKQTYPFWPTGSIHMICLREFSVENPILLVFYHAGQYFLAPNNGLLSMLFPDHADQIRCVTAQTGASVFEAQLRTIVYALDQIYSGQDLTSFTHTDFVFETGLRLRPVQTRERMRGTVIYADHYGNVITNIHRNDFETWLKGRAFKMILKRNDALTEISTSYASVMVGEPLALWSSSDLLMIAVHQGHAQQLLNLEQDDIIDILCV